MEDLGSGSKERVRNSELPISQTMEYTSYRQKLPHPGFCAPPASATIFNPLLQAHTRVRPDLLPHEAYHYHAIEFRPASWWRLLAPWGLWRRKSATGPVQESLYIDASRKTLHASS